jgi:hypothetical protein
VARVVPGGPGLQLLHPAPARDVSHSSPNASGATFDSIHFLLVALAPAQFVFQGDPLIANGCSLLVPIAGPDYVAMLPMTQYAFFLRSVRIPLPESLVNTTLYFQDFYTDPTMTQFVSTQRLEVQIVK